MIWNLYSTCVKVPGLEFRFLSDDLLTTLGLLRLLEEVAKDPLSLLNRRMDRIINLNRLLTSLEPIVQEMEGLVQTHESMSDGMPRIQLVTENIRPCQRRLSFEIQTLRAFMAFLHTTPPSTVDVLDISEGKVALNALYEELLPTLRADEENHVVLWEDLRQQLAMSGFSISELEVLKDTITTYISILSNQNRPLCPIDPPESELRYGDSSAQYRRRSHHHVDTRSSEKKPPVKFFQGTAQGHESMTGEPCHAIAGTGFLYCERVEKWVQEQALAVQSSYRGIEAEDGTCQRNAAAAPTATKPLRFSTAPSPTEPSPKEPSPTEPSSRRSSTDAKVESPGQDTDLCKDLSRASTLLHPGRDLEKGDAPASLPPSKPNVIRRLTKVMFGRLC